MRHNHSFTLVAVLLAASFSSVPAPARADEDTAKRTREAEETLATFKRADPGLAAFLERSAGWVVFPTVGKGGALIGGAHGSGVVFDRHGKAMGKATLTQVTVG